MGCPLPRFVLADCNAHVPEDSPLPRSEHTGSRGGSWGAHMARADGSLRPEGAPPAATDR